MSQKTRTKIDDLAQPARELTPEEEKEIRGGLLVPLDGSGGGATGATRLSTVTTYVHEGGHTAEDTRFDADQNE